MDGNQLGAILVARRKLVGWSQEKLAERSNVSVRTIRNLETGAIKNPRRSSVGLLLEALRSVTADNDSLVSHPGRPDVTAAALLPGFELDLLTDAVEVPPDAKWTGIRPKTDVTIGRQADVAHVMTMLRRGWPMVLTGPVGVGKTRLALECAARMLPRYRDGVAVLELGSLTPESADARAAAEVRRLIDQVVPSGGWTGSEPEMLLVIDNAEHLLDAVTAEVKALLARHPALHILITSLRAPALLPADLWEVAPLSCDWTDGAGAYPPAAELFFRRVHTAVPTLDLSDQMQDVVELCRRLGGIPLAVEHAAFRLRSVPLRILIDGQPVLPMLHQDDAGGLSHGRSLHRSMAWAYGLLDSSQRSVLRQLVRLPEEFTIRDFLESAADGDTPASGTLDILSDLVDFSAIQVRRNRQYVYCISGMMREYVGVVSA
ncbi:helix-turn-helix domain-containing protein [Streptomyces sp. NPDC040750]|uniref:helix-turn-helix domain-containing protein n=1 Tax=Streptomyces sp. NPDC040750 TaxID=3154491 RepID=UPI0033F5A4F3